MSSSDHHPKGKGKDKDKDKDTDKTIHGNGASETVLSSRSSSSRPSSSSSSQRGLSRVLHWGPMLALSVIVFISFSMIVACVHGNPPLEARTVLTGRSTVYPRGHPQHRDPASSGGSPSTSLDVVFKPWGALQLGVFLLMLAQILSNYFLAMVRGPGYAPPGWQSAVTGNVADFVQFCTLCDEFKAPRAHHCRLCNRCILRMDHHCPWVNNCVGHNNQRNFVLFVTWVPLTAVYTIYIMSHWCWTLLGSGRLLRLYSIDLVLCVFGVALSIGVMLAVAFLAHHQFSVIFRNMSDIEEWIADKASNRMLKEKSGEVFTYPYDLGRRANWVQVMGPGVLQLLWPWYEPSTSLDAQLHEHPGKRTALKQPITASNGVFWPVHETCHQFSFTQEQLKQKQRKLAHAQLVRVARPFSGRWWGFGIGGCRLLWNFPAFDDTQLAVSAGQDVLVLRGHKGWLYGENRGVGADSDTPNPDSTAAAASTSNNDVHVRDHPRGWFPEACVNVKES
ncbi:hypothetical protein CAOG_06043 [Capsaspora owczarzaki ATCC 30864]|uniref:Palmitoyltransferase n=1 Tax=Capsaspora owczarzaki (strain ATCC 30864) TaxID=595528 RepID=A0A0D2VVW1_CAPO3|nr:hypothetical protein CAOG_06043 [Capsaspora owczarzaki ATCC 30864]KJE95607.1 hypothetical protein CAOG_006043 [Capsaspora owczarzaki ATCC 30864]|eukprot:XP_004345633.1 hypothetical protein CAOG_06043 [Capsaspora owczarzaki ATCC 30864]